MMPDNIPEKLAKISLAIGAIKLNPEKPFTWASGYKMPLYNDNRLFLGDSEHRSLIAKGFQNLLNKHNVKAEVLAGTATAGIPHATTLADALQLPLIYVRSSAKSHGMGNRIEGPLKPKQQVLVIEDLISTGGSAVSAVQAVREAGGIVNHCFSIFSYGFTEAHDNFKSIDCEMHSILDLSQLLKMSQSTQKMSTKDLETIQSWQKAPFKWAENNGL
ncbi:MAG: orotate phosphoribosyltransferase [Nitrospinaceae bacterium]|jgi:orotate phosphoribosyltransferase|nr:orotate phosphoribosyltransferase [Nitrospinaceae bacterium]MBT6347500.1 orotate phosphoribosyltransferase [Nitrospina sp.]